jgi:hypothetical protein
MGDAPYSNGEMAALRELLQDTTAQRPPFVLHVGDIKGGGEPCSDGRIEAIAELFRDQPMPILYTPGDNEWTDCHRQSAGGREPLERLAALRRIMFSDPAVLHTAPLQPTIPNPAYPENLYFQRDGILFVLIHVVGSNNNYRPKNVSAMAEYQTRMAANRLLLEQAARAAKALDARALVLAFHANPLFEEQGPRRGFVSVKQDLRLALADYDGPLLLIHGDTHRFRFDQPLTNASGRAIDRFYRLEVPGSPSVAGVWISIDPGADRPFLVDVVYPSAYEMLR